MEIVVRRLKSDELYHHGVKGQNWGERHGPPYPLDSNSSKQAKRKRRAAMKAAKKQSKRDKKKAEEIKKQQEEIKKAIAEGDRALVNKYKREMSNEELEKAIKRLDLMDKIADVNSRIGQRRLREAREYIGAAKDITLVTTNIDKLARPERYKKSKNNS